MFKALGVVTYTAIIGVSGILAGAVGLCSLMVHNNDTIDATIKVLTKYKTVESETEVDSETEPSEAVTEEN